MLRRLAVPPLLVWPATFLQIQFSLTAACWCQLLHLCPFFLQCRLNIEADFALNQLVVCVLHFALSMTLVHNTSQWCLWHPRTQSKRCQCLERGCCQCLLNLAFCWSRKLMIISPCPAHSSGSMRPLVLQMPTAWRPRTPGHRVWDRSTDALKSPMMMSFSLPSTFQWSDSYSLQKASSHVGSTMNLLVYTLMMVGTLHP